jgi:ribonuclease III
VTERAGDDRREAALAELEARLGYRFKRPELLREAMRHSSAAHDRGVPSNERLEFLGDAALSHAAAEMVFSAWPTAGEGELTRGRAWLVREETLARLGEELDLASVLEREPGLECGPALLEDALEALLGAVLIDGGWARCKRVATGLLAPVMARLRPEELPRYEPKSTLQELAQRRHLPLPLYRQLAADGPAHRQVFVFEVELDGRVLGRGEGSSKRAAQQAAAQQALELLGTEEEVT